MECGSLFIYLVLSIPTHTSVLISGSVIPVSEYNSSAFVGFRHLVIAIHAWFSSGSSRCACSDLDHVGASSS